LFFFLAEGAGLAAYTFDKYLSEKPFKVKTLYLISEDPNGVYGEIKKGLHFAEAANYARDLVNEPPNVIYPETLRDAAIEISKQSELFDIEVFDKEKMERMGMQAILYVGKGSTKDPYFVHFSYRPEKRKKRVALVGSYVRQWWTEP